MSAFANVRIDEKDMMTENLGADLHNVTCVKNSLFHILVNYTEQLNVVRNINPTLSLGILLFSLFIYFCYVKAQRPKNFPKGPNPLPFIGNLHLTLQNKTFHLTVDNLAKKYGSLFGLQMSWFPMIVISDFKLVKKAFLEQHDIFNDRPMHLPYFKMLFHGKGVMVQNGDTWKILRKMTVSSLREFGMGKTSLEIKIQEEAVNMLQEVEKHDGRPFKLELMFHKAVSNIICSILFGQRFEYTNKEYEALIAGLDFIFKTGGTQNPYVFLPAFTFLTIPFTQPTVFKSIQQVRNIETFIMNRIQEHRDSYNASDLRDFVDLYLEAEQLNEKSSVFTDQNMKQVMMDVFMAGTETISQTLKWAFLFLLRHPDVQDKCREEIFKVIGTERLPSSKDRNEMPFMEATISEIQRFTASHGVFHTTSATTEFQGYTIPKGTLVIANIYSMHMDPKVWDQPKEFRPERFIDEHGNHYRSPMFMTYGIGKRSCPGENLVRQELFLFLTTMLQNFQFNATTDISNLPSPDDATLGITLEAPAYEIQAVKL